LNASSDSEGAGCFLGVASFSDILGGSRLMDWQKWSGVRVKDRRIKKKGRWTVEVIEM
jgi:hypothetical protein